jgi:hypothetical protein
MSVEASFLRSLRHLALGLFIGSAFLGAVLVAFSAPLWTFYVAPLVGIPAFLRLMSRAGGPALRPDADQDPSSIVLNDPPGAVDRFEGNLSLLLGAEEWRGDRRSLVFGLVTLSSGLAAVFITVAADSDVPALIQISLAAVAFLSLAVGFGLHQQERRHRRTVFYYEDRWVVDAGGKILSQHQTLEQATRAARDRLQAEGGGELVVKDRDGEVRETDTVAPRHPR